jgi:hypothetical protein
MSKRLNKDGSPRKVRRDDKLNGLPEAQRGAVADWLSEDGWESCLQRLRSELGIETNKTSLYEALARWRTEARFTRFHSLAMAQAQLEAEAKGGMTAEQLEEAVDRNFLMMAAEAEDTTLYKELRYLRVADQSAKSNARIAEAKLRQGDKKIAQKTEELKLATRRVELLEAKAREALETVNNSKLSATEQAARIREIFGK